MYPALNKLYFHISYNLLFILLLPLFLVQLNGNAQDMLGASLGNYSGVNGMRLNPSVMNSSKAWLNVNVLSADFFLENNYLYVSRSDYSFNNFFRAGYEFPSHPEQYGTEDRMFYWKNSKDGKDAYQQLLINGPGATLIKDRHAFGITTALRSVFSVRNIPYDIANFSYLGLNYRPQHNINFKENKPFRTTEMTWAEIGLSYSYEIYQRNYTRITAGASVKRLFGYAGTYGYVTNMDYIVPDDSTIIVNNLNAEIGYSLPLEYSSSDLAAYSGPLIKGGGFAFDVGITYTKLRRLPQQYNFTSFCAQNYDPYDFRLGIALIDFGAIKFKENAVKGRIDNRSSYWENVRSFKFTTIQELMDTVSYRFYGNDTALYTGNSFYLWLPASLSVQFDYHLYRNYFVNASLIYGFPVTHAAIVRPAVLSVTPRYETRWFEASLPISLYDWYLPRVGLAVRAWWLTLGTEKLGQFFNMRNFTGMDFYFSINFFFEKGHCRNTNTKGCADREYQIKK